MRQISAFITKEMKILVRERGSFILLFIIPAIFIISLSVALQGAFSSSTETGQKLDMLVINHDKGDVGKKLISDLEKTGRFNIVTGVDGSKLTRSRAIQEINHNKFEIALIIPKGASRALYFRERKNVEILTDPAVGSEFMLYINGTIEKFIHVSLLKWISGRSLSGRKDENGLYVKQSYTTAKGKEVTPNSVQQNVPGWTIFALFWIAQTLAISIISERLQGAYRRILAAPVSHFSYTLGKAIPIFIINMIQALFLFAVGIYILPLLNCPELVIKNYAGLALVTAAISFSAICLGLLFASICDSLFSLATVSVAVLIVSTILGGIMVPRFIMPDIMQDIGLFVPQSWALDAYLNILIRDYSIMQVMPQVGAIMGFGVLFYCLSRVITWRREGTV